MGIKMVELFCGAGLLGSAFDELGFETQYACDLDDSAIQTLKTNRPDANAVVQDVRVVRPVKTDLIVAGPPCQGFSTLGKRDRRDERNALSLELCGWAKATDPSVIVIENVPQFVGSYYSDTLERRLAKMGFARATWMLDASEHGCAQFRTRSFSIFSRIGLPRTPPKSRHRPVVADAFSGLGNTEDDPLHIKVTGSKIASQRIKQIPIGGSRFDIMESRPDLCPPSWWRLGRQAVDVWGRMHWQKPSNTIRCCFYNPSKGRYIHPEEDRVITLREGARLQGVPDHWQFVGYRTQIARQIGNGVPIPLAQSVAKQVASLFHASSSSASIASIA